MSPLTKQAMLQKYIENKNKTNEQASTKKKKKDPDLFTTACSWMAAQNYYHSISIVCSADFIQLTHVKTTSVLSTLGLQIRYLFYNFSPLNDER